MGLNHQRELRHTAKQKLRPFIHAARLPLTIAHEGGRDRRRRRVRWGLYQLLWRIYMRALSTRAFSPFPPTLYLEPFLPSHPSSCPICRLSILEYVAWKAVKFH